MADMTVWCGDLGTEKEGGWKDTDAKVEDGHFAERKAQAW